MTETFYPRGLPNEDPFERDKNSKPAVSAPDYAVQDDVTRRVRDWLTARGEYEAVHLIEQLAARAAALDALEAWLRRDYAVYCGITIYAEDPGKPFQIELRPGRRDVDAPHENAIWCRDHADLASAIRAALARVIDK